jgi:transposase
MLRALRAVGFTGGKRTVERWLAQQDGSAPERAKRAVSSTKPPSIRAILWQLLRPGEGDGEPSKTLATVYSACPELQTASELARQMFAMARERRADQLEGWLQSATASPFQEFRTLATGLELDRGAVEAALSSPWSTGQVEGQNHRLKLVKRQMYGRAGFELLRQRVLHAI